MKTYEEVQRRERVPAFMLSRREESMEPNERKYRPLIARTVTASSCLL